jgi:hypothetical protein
MLCNNAQIHNRYSDCITALQAEFVLLDIPDHHIHSFTMPGFHRGGIHRQSGHPGQSLSLLCCNLRGHLLRHGPVWIRWAPKFIDHVESSNWYKFLREVYLDWRCQILDPGSAKPLLRSLCRGSDNCSRTKQDNHRPIVRGYGQLAFLRYKSPYGFCVHWHWVFSLIKWVRRHLLLRVLG